MLGVLPDTVKIPVNGHKTLCSAVKIYSINNSFWAFEGRRYWQIVKVILGR